MMKLNSLLSRNNKGKVTEDIACSYLKRQGLQLIEKNFHSRFGEIDLIMQHQEAVVFIEVRYRKSQQYGGAKASITLTKQTKLRKTALVYMQIKGRELNARFDVIAISGCLSNSSPTDEKNLNIEWIKNAF